MQKALDRSVLTCLVEGRFIRDTYIGIIDDQFVDGNRCPTRKLNQFRQRPMAYIG